MWKAENSHWSICSDSNRPPCADCCGCLEDSSSQSERHEEFCPWTPCNCCPAFCSFPQICECDVSWGFPPLTPALDFWVTKMKMTGTNMLRQWVCKAHLRILADPTGSLTSVQTAWILLLWKEICSLIYQMDIYLIAINVQDFIHVA